MTVKGRLIATRRRISSGRSCYTLTEEARSETPAQDTIGQSPSAEKK
ncbi:MAG: hypothetical protein ACLT8V_06915 [Streptococcus salivarius]